MEKEFFKTIEQPDDDKKRLFGELIGDRGKSYAEVFPKKSENSGKTADLSKETDMPEIPDSLKIAITAPLTEKDLGRLGRGKSDFRELQKRFEKDEYDFNLAKRDFESNPSLNNKERMDSLKQWLNGSRRATELYMTIYEKCRKLVFSFLTPLTELIPGVSTKDLGCIDNNVGDLKSEDSPISHFNDSVPGGRYEGDTEKSPSVYFGKDSFSRNKSEREKLRNALKGQVVIDIGAGGYDQDIEAYVFAAENSAAGYVAVEPYNMDNLIRNFAHFFMKKKAYKKNLPVSFAEMGGLEFLRALPDHSVSIITSGLEIIHDQEYVRQLKKEIHRVLSPQGAWLIGNANFDVSEEDIKGIENRVWQSSAR